MRADVADRWAFVVAVDKPLNQALGASRDAESGAKQILSTLKQLGVAATPHDSLWGQYATKAAIDSRLRRFRKSLRKGHTAFVILAGRIQSERFLCWDTLPDDIHGTGLSLHSLFTMLDNSQTEQVIHLWDVSTNADTDLTEFGSQARKSVVLAATSSGEDSQSSSRQKSSIWSALLIAGLSGRATKAADPSGHVTALSLHRSIVEEMPRELLKSHESGVQQTPRLLGEHHGGLILCHRSSESGDWLSHSVIHRRQVRRVVFRSHRITRVKDLTGFRKTYTVPTTARSANRKFVIRIAAEDLKTDVHGVLESAQRLLGYRRKDVEVGIDGEGAAYLRTPDFEYVVSVSLDSSDPSQVEWHREIGQFRDADFLRSPEFETIFGKLFDQLVLEFSTPLALPDWVDRLEESTVKGLRLHYSSRDGEECRITLSGHSGQVIVTSSALSIQGSIGDTRGLLDQFLKLLTAAESAGESLALPISTIDRKN